MSISLENMQKINEGTNADLKNFLGEIKNYNNKLEQEIQNSGRKTPTE